MIQHLSPVAAALVGRAVEDAVARLRENYGSARILQARRYCLRYELGCRGSRRGEGVSLGRSVTRCGRRGGGRCGAVEDLNFQLAAGDGSLHPFPPSGAREVVNIHPRPLISVNKYTQSRLGRLKKPN